MTCAEIQKKLNKYRDFFLNSRNQLKRIKIIDSIEFKQFLSILEKFQKENELDFNLKDSKEIKNLLIFIFKENCQFKCFYPECNNFRQITQNKAGVRISKFCQKHSKKEYINKYKSLIQKNKKILKETVLKCKYTNIMKYGVDNPMKNREIQKKVSNRWCEKSKKEIELIVKKREQKNLEKYGVTSAIQSAKIKEKIKKTNFEKYGAKTWAESHLKNRDKLNKEFIEKNFLNKKRNFLVDKFIGFFNCSTSKAYQYLKELNIEFKRRGGTSKYEDQIFEYIMTLFNENENARNR